MTAAPSGFHDLVRAFRKAVIRDALHACGGNRTRAATLLGLQRTYLIRLIREYGISARRRRPGRTLMPYSRMPGSTSGNRLS